MSKPLTLNKTDWKSVARGAAVAAAGAVLAYLASEVVPFIDQSTATGASLAAIGGVLVNIARKWITETETK